MLGTLELRPKSMHVLCLLPLSGVCEERLQGGSLNSAGTGCGIKLSMWSFMFQLFKGWATQARPQTARSPPLET